MASSNKIHRSSIYRQSALAKYLEGMIDFKADPISEGAPLLNLYPGSRDRLLVDNDFGDCLSRMLTYAEVEIIKPAVQKYEDKVDIRQDTMRSTRINNLLHDFFRKNQTDFSWLYKSQAAVQDHTIKCPKCGERYGVLVLDKSPMVNKINKMLLYNNKYTCGNCHHEWDRSTHEEYKARDYTIEATTEKPIYKAPENLNDSKERKKLYGYGYNVVVSPFARSDSREFFIAPPSTIEINSNHPVYKQIKNGKVGGFLSYHELRMAIMAMMAHSLKHHSMDDIMKQTNSALSALEKWYSSERTDISASISQDV
jgi:hypothetical protein